MSETAVATDTPEPIVESDHHADDHGHPSEGQYWIVFFVLAAITAVEVLWSYLDVSGPALVLPLIAMMLVKFVIVAGVFMHLYFDMKMLNGRVFSMMFGAGIVLACVLYFIVFGTFEFEI